MTIATFLRQPVKKQRQSKTRLENGRDQKHIHGKEWKGACRAREQHRVQTDRRCYRPENLSQLVVVTVIATTLCAPFAHECCT